MIEKEFSSIEIESEPNKNQLFLRECSDQLRDGLGLPDDTPFEVVINIVKQDLKLAPSASSDEIVEAILKDLNQTQ
jgi:hypothetical protein